MYVNFEDRLLIRILKYYSKNTSVLKLEDVDVKAHGISMVSISTVVSLVVRRSTFLARPVTIDELLSHHVCMLMHDIESCPDFWGVVNSGVFFMRFHCTVPIACFISPKQHSCYMSHVVDLPIIANVMELSDVIKVNGQASIPVTFCWGWIW